MNSASADAKKERLEAALAIVESDVSSAEDELRRINAERETIDQRLTALRQVAANLKQYIDMLRFQPPSVMPSLPLDMSNQPSSGPALSPSPRTHAEACLVVLRERKGRPATLRDLADELQHRGWMDRDLKHPIEIVRGTMKTVAQREPLRVSQVQENPIAYTYIASGTNNT